MCVQYDTRSCIGTWFTIGDRVGLVIAMGGGVYNYYGVLYCSTLYMIQPRSSQSHAQFFIIEESGGGLVPGGWMPLMRLILCYRVFHVTLIGCSGVQLQRTTIYTVHIP